MSKRDHKASEQDWRSNEASRSSNTTVIHRADGRVWPAVKFVVIASALGIAAHQAWLFFGG